jgi:type I restriction enzyme S subunit
MTLNLDKTEWKRVTLGEVAAASKEKVDPSDGSIERFIAGEHMSTNDLKIHRWGDTAEVDLGPAFHRRFRPGQILYGSRRTYLRKVAVADFDGVCANTTFVVETKDEGALLQEFLPFIMTAEPFHAFAIAESKGSVNPYVNWSDIERYEFDLPPLDEQKRIADLLWSVERHRRSLADLAQVLTGDQMRDESAARAALLNHLLAGADETWIEVPLGKVGTLTRGRRFTKKDYVDTGIGCIHYGQIYTDFDEVAKETVTFLPETLRSSLRFAQPGDVIVAGTSENVDDVCKAVAWVGDEDVAVHDDCFIFKHDLDPRFASYVFASTIFQQQKAGFTSETKVVRVSAANLAKIVIPVPPRVVQTQIVDAVDEIAHTRDAIRQEESGVNATYSALLSEIFGGK